VAWLPLVPCPPELGGLALAPGTHRAGLLPHEGEHGEAGIRTSLGARWATGELEPGDVVLFHGLTVHCALLNTTQDRVRLSCDYRFGPAGT
jgi:ectoine hydroxylase-related dioxygenase (phytanoyl-CoA dioxygenase family)